MIRTDYELRCGEKSDIADHLPRLHTEASIPDVKVIELGVRSGNSTAAFLTAATEHNGHVWSVDIAWPHVPKEWTGLEQWTFLLGDDLLLADQLPNDVDIVFIDTAHTYELTVAELETYAPKLRPGGRFLLHDTELEHPDASPASDPPFPVAKAIQHWTASREDVNVEWVPGCYGLAVITIGESDGSLCD